MHDGWMHNMRIIAALAAAALALAAGPGGLWRQAPAAGARGGQVHAAGEFWVALPMLFRNAGLAELPTPVVVVATATPVPSTSTPTTAPPTATDTPRATEVPTLTPTSTEIPSSPTPEPTNTPEATPTEPPKPTPASECRELAVNGGFEQGASGWSLYTNAGATNNRLSRVIVQPADNRIAQPHGGDWYAELGGFTGFDGIVDELTNPDPASGAAWALPAAQDIVSATLRFYYTIETQEPRNFVANDRFSVAFINGDKSLRTELLETPLSEESTEQGVWRAYRFDVTGQLTKRRQWDSARLVMKSENSMNLATRHILDDVSVTLCTKPAPLHAPRPERHRSP